MTQFGTDFAFAVVTLLVTLVLANGGAARAGVRLCSILFAGLFTMNYFEPVARLAIDVSHSATPIARYARFVCFIGLFAAAQIVLWALSKRLLPESIEMPKVVEQCGRWGCGIASGWITAAILLTAVHTFPGSRDFGGLFPPEADRRTSPILKTSPDYQWLGFTQHVSEHVFRQPGNARVFDGPQQRIGTVSGRWSSFPIRYAEWRENLDTKNRSNE